MNIDLTNEEIHRILNWARGCDRESWIGENDWPLIEKLAKLVDTDPERVAPFYERD